MTGLGSPIQGVTLYSFTRAFHGREYDLEGLIRKTAAEGYGPGLEIIGFSSFRGFPEIDDAYEGQGLGSRLARAALDDARGRGLRVRPLCPFIRGWIKRHEDYQDLVVPTA